MDREAWRAAVHGVTKSRTWLSNWTELNTINLAVNIFRVPNQTNVLKIIWATIHKSGYFYSQSYLKYEIRIKYRIGTKQDYSTVKGQELGTRPW